MQVDAPLTERLNRTTLHAGAKHACNHLNGALADLAHITLDLANRKVRRDRDLADLAHGQLGSARQSIQQALKAIRHAERHVARCLGREPQRSQLDAIRAVACEARLSDSEARAQIVALLKEQEWIGIAPIADEG